ncbi:MAG: hydrogenase maturation protease, partial [Acidobacteria bacterium]|nr:hydrogenase maturation protease [Acidobacteriota bacterium]
MKKPATKSYHALFLCCGNMDRGDDAVGPLCAAALEARKSPARTIRGDASEFLEAWQQARHVIVVDALTGGLAPGTLRRMEASSQEFRPQEARCSSQGTGLSHAWRLAGLLKCVPSSLVLLGLEAAEFEWAATQSAEVVAAMPALVDAVEA